MDRALIIAEPWISKILSGEKKTWEVRSRKTKIRGKVGLIRSGSGLIVGECEIVDCISQIYSGEVLLKYYNKHLVADTDLLRKWHVAWVLENAKALPEPRPYIHPKGAVVWVKL